MIPKLLLTLTITIYGSLTFAQSQDSTVVVDSSYQLTTAEVQRHSPAKAAIFSAVLPGLGQAYNRKYWKIPIVYAGLGGLSYSIGVNAKQWKDYSNALRLRIDEDSTTIDKYDGELTESAVRAQKERYKRNMDISIIFTAVFYALNIIDAAVDAHFFEFDVSDDLSMRIQPVIDYRTNGNSFTGISLNLRLK